MSNIPNMSVEKSFSITLKFCMSESGSFESIRLLKGRSKLNEDVLIRLNKVLQDSLVPSAPLKSIVAIGNDAEQAVMDNFLNISQVNNDFDVIDTSSKTGHGDMAVLTQGKRICVEVKNYSKSVPMKEIEKYHKSLNLSEYDAGIMIQSNSCGFCAESGIRSPIDIRIHKNKPTAYLTAIDYKLLYPLITMMLSIIKHECNENDLELKRKSLLSIYEQVSELRSCVDIQKKSITRLEASIETIATLSQI